ncbi:MAG: hypoxanthine phosphoribosyltransferase [Saprospiraceae bacterium]
MSEKRIRLHDLEFELMYSREVLASRVEEIGAALCARYRSDTPVFVSVLTGAFVFAADLIRAYDGPCEARFVRLASYEGIQSGPELRTLMDLDADLSGRHLIVVEDIVDTGRTLYEFLRRTRAQAPASLCVVALLSKPEARRFDVPLDHVGFNIPDAFVVGYGLDYSGLGRNLPDLYQLRSGPTAAG